MVQDPPSTITTIDDQVNEGQRESTSNTASCIAAAIVRSIRFRRDDETGTVRVVIEPEQDESAQQLNPSLTYRMLVEDDGSALPDDPCVRIDHRKLLRSHLPFCTQVITELLQPVLAHASPLLTSAQVYTTNDNESVVRQYVLPLDGGRPQSHRAAAKRFDAGYITRYTQVWLHWQPTVTLEQLQHATTAALQHLCMLAVPVRLGLQLPNMCAWHHEPLDDSAQAAANTFATMVDAAPHELLAVAGIAVNSSRRPTYGGHVVSCCCPKNAIKCPLRWAAHAVLVLQPHAQCTSEPDAHHLVPVYAFHDHAPSVHLPALQGVYKAQWQTGGLEAVDMLLAQGPMHAGPCIGTHQATLVLSPASTAAPIAALVVQVEPCRQHPARPLLKASPAVETRVVRRAVEGAIAAAKAACPGVLLSIAEQRLEVALPALADALAGIAVRSSNDTLLQAAGRAAGLATGDKDDLACALCARLHALLQPL